MTGPCAKVLIPPEFDHDLLEQCKRSVVGIIQWWALYSRFWKFSHQRYSCVRTCLLFWCLALYTNNWKYMCMCAHHVWCFQTLTDLAFETQIFSFWCTYIHENLQTRAYAHYGWCFQYFSDLDRLSDWMHLYANAF